VEIVVRRPRGGTVGYWLKSLLGSMCFGVSDAEDRDAAVVIARTRSGQEHVLQRTGTYRQAMRAGDRFKRELRSLGEEEFRRHYGLPVSPPR
jgi:hypothetical protein